MSNFTKQFCPEFSCDEVRLNWISLAEDFCLIFATNWEKSISPKGAQPWGHPGVLGQEACKGSCAQTTYSEFNHILQITTFQNESADKTLKHLAMLPGWRRRIRSNRTPLPTLVGGIFYQAWICVLTRSLTHPVTFGWLDWRDSDWWICIPKRCWLCCWCWSWF